MDLHIDIETYSEVDLKTCGAYKYAENCEIILFAYRYDRDPTIVIDMLKDEIPQHVIDDLKNPNIVKKAFNAAFERACIQEFLMIETPPEQWRCTMVKCAMAGLPMNLDDAAKVLAVENQKDAEGKALIRYFCIPCKPTKTNNFRTRNLPEHAPEKWEKFKTYNGTDVDAECDVEDKITWYKISDEENAAWCLDQRINERGVYVDIPFSKQAIVLDSVFRDRLISEAKLLTGLENPNSIAQVKLWIEERLSIEISSLNKEEIPALINLAKNNKNVSRMLKIREALSKTSVKKYGALVTSACFDMRLRGLIQYYGASRTGRAAGRIFQPHNLPRGHFSDITDPRNLVMAGDADYLEMFYGAIPNTLSALLRSAIIPSPGNKLLVSDFSAIEARVIAWVSDEQWRLDVFKTHGKIYEASASQMFKIPLEAIGKDSYHRQAGKVAELALGYQGGANALLRMCQSLAMDLPEEDMPNIVTAWRKASPNIVKFWKITENAAKKSMTEGGKIFFGKGMYFEYKNGVLLLTLPSGRKLSYYNAKLVEGKFGAKITYWGIDQTKKILCRMDAYGGKFVENLVQAIARDCLYFALKNIDNAGIPLVLHVHDEAVADVPQNRSIKEMNDIMTIVPPWATGLPLAAAGFETLYYKK